jgi:hypothetical protein
MGKLLGAGLFVVFWFFSVSSAMADNTKTALDEISGFAERVCQTAPLKSSSNELDLSLQANADLKGLVSKVAGLGIDGAAKYKNNRSEGVLQKDLAPLLIKSVDCKERVSNKLIDKLIEPTPPRAAAPAPAHDPDTIYQRGMPVGHVTGAEPRLSESAVYFAAVKDTQNLDKNRNFQYREWILHIAGQPQQSTMFYATNHGPEMAVLEGLICRIVGSATDPNSP